MRASRALLDARLVMFAILVPGARARLAGSLHEARAALEHPMSDEARVLLGPLTADLLFQGAPAADVRALAERALVGGELMRTRRGDRIGLRPRRARRAHPRRRPSRREAAHRRRRCARPGARIPVRARTAVRITADCSTGGSASWPPRNPTPSSRCRWRRPGAFHTRWRPPSSPRCRSSAVTHAGARRHLDSLGHDEAILEVTPNQIVRETHATLLLAEGRAREALVQLHACAHWQEQSGMSAPPGPRSRGVRRLRWRTPRLGETERGTEARHVRAAARPRVRGGPAARRRAARPRRSSRAGRPA